MNKNKYIIIIYCLITLGLLYITENIFHPIYPIQMFQKIFSFLVIPIFLWKYLWVNFWKFWKFNKNSLLYWILFWILWVIIIYSAYLLLYDYISWNLILESINSRWVTISTFVIIFTYIMLWNSLLEEYFFRWIVFHTLEKKYTKLAYALNSLLFSLYHIVLFWTWFKWYILYIALMWLFVGWIFFSWLYKKTNWIWAAYIFHILADAIILIIWYKEFFI